MKIGLIKAIDNMLLFRCIQLVKKIQKHDYSTSFFCNVSPATRADQFFQEFRKFLSATKISPPASYSNSARLTLPLIRRKSLRTSSVLTRWISVLHGSIVDLDFDAEALAELGFHFVKVGWERSCRRRARYRRSRQSGQD